MDTFVAYRLVDGDYVEYFLSCKRMNGNEPADCPTLDGLGVVLGDWLGDLYEGGEVSLSFEVPAEAAVHNCSALDENEQSTIRAVFDRVLADCKSDT